MASRAAIKEDARKATAQLILQFLGSADDRYDDPHDQQMFNDEMEALARKLDPHSV